MKCVETVVDSGLDVYAHNIETVERLTRFVQEHNSQVTYQVFAESFNEVESLY